MIPKRIHYCWFGGAPLPKLAQKCIASWKKHCSSYEIVRWDESSFDLSYCSYVHEAAAAKKWAFVSDVARFWILFQYGGIYFDTDVELIRPIDDIVTSGPFMAKEKDDYINPGLGIGSDPGRALLKELLMAYEKRRFFYPNGSRNETTVCEYTTKAMKSYGFRGEKGSERVGGFTIFPVDYFCPKDLENGRITLTDNTRAIHHYSASWMTPKQRFHTKVAQIIGPEWTDSIKKLIH